MFKNIRAELPCEAQIGRGFVIDHCNAIVVSPFARFGDRCRIRTGTVVGLSRVDVPAVVRPRRNAS
jgi:serine O-acetyltransferase